jgi:hypothetical protein
MCIPSIPQTLTKLHPIGHKVKLKIAYDLHIIELTQSSCPVGEHGITIRKVRLDLDPVEIVAIHHRIVQDQNVRRRRRSGPIVAAKRRRRICRLLAPETGLFGGFSAAGGDGKRPGILVKQTAVAVGAGAVEGVAVVIAVAVGMMAVLQAVAVGSGGSSGGCRAFAEQCCNLV